MTRNLESVKDRFRTAIWPGAGEHRCGGRGSTCMSAAITDPPGAPLQPQASNSATAASTAKANCTTRSSVSFLRHLRERISCGHRQVRRQRARLTFVPQHPGPTCSMTCGRTVAQGTDGRRTRLFMTRPPYRFVQAAEDTGWMSHTGACLEEVDSTLKGFEQTNACMRWLGDLGMNAEAQLWRKRSAGRWVIGRAW